MASNTNTQLVSLDFANIKQNFISYLQSQNTFKDYNFSGSALSTLLDVLAYNTQYNAYYLNMVANEMFLDSAQQRSSVVSLAKVLNYVPQSAQGSTGLINIAFTNINTTTFTIPKNTNFVSGPINGVNYNYVTTQTTTVPVTANTATFTSIELKQGTPQIYTYTVNSSSNPKYIFEIPDVNVDTSTISITVQQSSSNISSQVYNLATDLLELTPTSQVYFLQEATNGNYQIYFGDGVLGQQLSDGNLVIVNYLSTNGSAGGQANSYYLMDNLGNSTIPTITPVSRSSVGKDKETIDSIKFQAPKAYASQGRAVSKNDYITIIQQNNMGIPIEAVSVWGGEENDPPVYGQVFIALKPSGSYTLTPTQKLQLVNDVIKPISVLTVEPTIVDPDYTYLQINANVEYVQSQTQLTPGGLQNAVQTSLYNYAAAKLNTFNSVFNPYDVYTYINNSDNSIVSADFILSLQKKFYPALNSSTTYTFSFNVELKRGLFGSSISSYPDITILDPTDPTNTVSGIYFEEVPTSTNGIDTISILTTGYNYQQTPSVIISGDGSGATAVANIVNGALQSITVTNPGIGYTAAVVQIVNATGDTLGSGASAVANLQGRYGIIRAYRNDPVFGKTVVAQNVGTIDYVNGIVTLTNFIPTAVNNPLGQLVISVLPNSNIISSTYNKILTIDVYDSSAIDVNVIPKRS